MNMITPLKNQSLSVEIIKRSKQSKTVET